MGAGLLGSVWKQNYNENADKWSTLDFFTFKSIYGLKGKWAYPGVFLLSFRSFQTILVFSGIQTRIVGLEGKRADLLTTTTTAQGLKGFAKPVAKLCGYLNDTLLFFKIEQI